MRTISCKLEDLKTMVIHIGYESENDYTSIRIDAGSVFAEYPQAVPALKVQPPKGSAYPAIVTRDGNIVIWNVKASDTAHNGNGEGQLTFTEGEVVKKGPPFKIVVHRSLQATGTAPDPIQDFIDEAEWIVQDAEEAAEKAEAAASHAPTIGNDGYWYRWDSDAEEYVSTGTQAQGPQGDPGSPGDPTELIDDTAGTGTTGKTWSADKLDAEKTSVLNAIDGILDHETYQDGSGTEYDPVAASNTVASARFTINDHNVAYVSTPTTTSMNIYPVQQGKTYKVKGYCNGTLNRPLLIVADSAITSSIIAYENEYDSELGTAVETPAVDELEYTALRNGYLYINYSDSSCGVWLKKTVTQTKYHIDDVMEDVGSLKEDVAQNESDITDILSNETYPGTGSAEYEAVAQDKSADSSRMTINSSDKVFVSTPTTTKLKTYPVIVTDQKTDLCLLLLMFLLSQGILQRQEIMMYFLELLHRVQRCRKRNTLH